MPKERFIPETIITPEEDKKSERKIGSRADRRYRQRKYEERVEEKSTYKRDAKRDRRKAGEAREQANTLWRPRRKPYKRSVQKEYDEFLITEQLEGVGIQGLLYEIGLAKFPQVDQPTNPELINRFREASSENRLKLLTKNEGIVAIDCVLSLGGRAAERVHKRLEFYQKLVNGKGLRVDDRTREVPTPESIRAGLLRDLLYATMIGTPELAAHQIAMKRLSRGGKPVSDHAITLRGYHSGIAENRIGNYKILIDTYRQALKQKQRKGEQDPEKLERDAVRLAADWYEKAVEYNAPDRSPHSSYSASHEEAIHWARLDGACTAAVARNEAKN